MGKKERKILSESDSPGKATLYDSKSDKVFLQYANKQVPFSTASANSTLTSYSGPWTRAEVIHLLRRTTLGLKHSDVTTLLALSCSDAVDLLIDSVPSTAPDPPVNNYFNVQPDTTVLPERPWVLAPYGDGNINFQRQQSFKSWWISLMLNESLNIRERMTLFWHNHFATETNAIENARDIYNHHALLRSNALGNFRTLTSAVTTDIGMLRYLNGDKNTASSPDENYGRELQELFTLGTTNSPNYTQADVAAAAKVLTGWRIGSSGAVFDPTKHSTGDKQFSSFYGNAVIQYQAGADGGRETQALIDMIFGKIEVAKHICRAIYRFFVYYVIDVNVENTIIAPMANTLVANNYEIKPVMRQLLKSDHFFDALNRGCYIKTPLDFLIGSFKTFGVALPSTMTVENRYKVYNYFRNYAVILGQDPGDPPNVAGWPAFHQKPEYYQSWINSNTLPKRLIFTDVLLSNGFNAGGATFKIDSVAFAKQCTSPEDPNVLIDFFTEMLLAVPLSSSKKISLKSILLSNQSSDAYWSLAWMDYNNNPTVVNDGIVRTRLNPLLIEFTRMAEHQLA